MKLVVDEEEKEYSLEHNHEVLFLDDKDYSFIKGKNESQILGYLRSTVLEELKRKGAKKEVEILSKWLNDKSINWKEIVRKT